MSTDAKPKDPPAIVNAKIMHGVLAGRTQAEIAAGLDINQSTVSRRMATMRTEWRETRGAVDDRADELLAVLGAVLQGAYNDGDRKVVLQASDRIMRLLGLGKADVSKTRDTIAEAPPSATDDPPPAGVVRMCFTLDDGAHGYTEKVPGDGGMFKPGYVFLLGLVGDSLGAEIPHCQCDPVCVANYYNLPSCIAAKVHDSYTFGDAVRMPASYVGADGDGEENVYPDAIRPPVLRPKPKAQIDVVVVDPPPWPTNGHHTPGADDASDDVLDDNTLAVLGASMYDVLPTPPVIDSPSDVGGIPAPPADAPQTAPGCRCYPPCAADDDYAPCVRAARAQGTLQHSNAA